MERNSDLIVMASYAPLFVNVNPGGMQWETDLIGYDALTSYGSPSYWAQVLFGKYLGTEVVTATLANAGPHVYTSVTRDEKQHKLFIKVVNASSDAAPSPSRPRSLLSAASRPTRPIVLRIPMRSCLSSTKSRLPDRTLSTASRLTRSTCWN
jgi:alpha-L-arabinofuranosidase